MMKHLHSSIEASEEKKYRGVIDSKLAMQEDLRNTSRVLELSFLKSTISKHHDDLRRVCQAHANHDNGVHMDLASG